METTLNIKRTPGICPACGKPNHPLAQALNTKGSLCDSCLDKALATSAQVVCTKCNALAALVAPGETQSGFVFDKNKTYHVKHCPNCKPTFKNIQIIELHEYLEEKGLLDEEEKYVQV